MRHKSYTILANIARESATEAVMGILLFCGQSGQGCSCGSCGGFPAAAATTTSDVHQGWRREIAPPCLQPQAKVARPPLLQLCGFVQPRRRGVYRAGRHGQAPRHGEAPDLQHCQRPRECRDFCEEGQEPVLLDRLRRGPDGIERALREKYGLAPLPVEEPSAANMSDDEDDDKLVDPEVDTERRRSRLDCSRRIS